MISVVGLKVMAAECSANSRILPRAAPSRGQAVAGTRSGAGARTRNHAA